MTQFMGDLPPSLAWSNFRSAGRGRSLAHKPADRPTNHGPTKCRPDSSFHFPTFGTASVLRTHVRINVAPCAYALMICASQHAILIAHNLELLEMLLNDTTASTSLHTLAECLPVRRHTPPSSPRLDFQQHNRNDIQLYQRPTTS